MTDFTKTKEYGIWVAVHSLVVLLLVPYFMMRYFAENYYGTLYNYYIYMVPVLVAFYFFFRRGKDGAEVKLILAYCIWFIISRALNGDFSLSSEISWVRELFLISVAMPTCMLLCRKKRAFFLDCLSIIVCTYYSILSAIGLYAYTTNRVIVNPISGNLLASFYSEIRRLCFYELGPNIVSLWFLISFFLAVYLFFRAKKWFFRVPLVIAASLNYLTIAVTYCRNVMLALSIGTAMLAILIAFKFISSDKNKLKVLAVILSLCIVTPLVYSGFSTSVSIINKIADNIAVTQETVSSTVKENGNSPVSENNPSAVTPDAAEEENLIMEKLVGTRGFDNNGRFELWLAVAESFKAEPLRLLRGCPSWDIMRPVNPLISKPLGHVHCSYLHVLCVTGIPGFAIIAAFLFLLVKRMILLFFSSSPEIGIEVKVLVILLTGVFLYNALDSSLFYDFDIRSFVPFIVSGAVIAYSKDSAKI